MYATPAVINPGDRLETTCSFTNTTDTMVTFGERTEDEMCFNFVLAWPANALQSQLPLNFSQFQRPGLCMF